MIEFVTIQDANLRAGQHVPPFLELLVTAARRGDEIAPHVEAIARAFGFEAFEYTAWATPRPDRSEVTHAYTTADGEWLRRYDRMGYVGVDPRMLLTSDSAIPLVWDQANIRGLGPETDAFVDDALRHAIASGVSFMWHGARGGHMAVTLSSAVRVNDEVRRQWIARNLSDIVMFGHYFHEVFMLPALESGRAAVPPLSERERECLSLAAKGLTTKDISVKLAISSRTVQFHFERICGKLGAVNRHEAIARAVQTGAISGEWPSARMYRS
jgi:DNA-binding CsgD family transcriptional regulator